MTDVRENNASEYEQHNRRAQVAGSLFSKLADALANTKIVLPALFHAIAAPTFFVGLISPIRESLSMLPQIFLSSRVNKQLRPQHIYTLGAIVQALALAVMLMVFLNLKGWPGGVGILSALVLFSLARSLCSLSSKTVLGATVRKSNRGGLMGVAGTIAGGISIVYGMCLYLATRSSTIDTGNPEPTSSTSALLSESLSNQHWALSSLLVVACVLFILAAFSYRAVRWENSSQNTQSRDHSQASYVFAWRLLREDRYFRRFVVTRAFMMVSALALPYIAMLAMQSSYSGHLSAIGLFAMLVIIEGFSGLLSSRLWGLAADKNSRFVLLMTALLSTVLCALSAAAIQHYNSAPAWVWLSIYALMSLTHNGVRLGRKTYIVDLADDQKESLQKRTEYVAVSNTAIGVLLLFLGVLSALLAQTSLLALFTLFTASSCVAALLSLGLKRL